nr:hypothetical protein [Deltaproteobacteria bacterium]
MTFDAVIVADSPHARTVLLGLTLVERARRVAGRVGARRTFVIEDAASAAGLAAWDTERGDAALLVVRGGDRLVHPPLIEPLLEGTADRRLAVGPTGTYAGALWARGEAAREVITALAASPANGDAEV